jgi:uncharacterized protein DUF4124
MTPFPIVAALLCLSCAPAGAAEIYKSMGPDGVVKFSNMPADQSGGDVRMPYAGVVGPGPPAALDPLNEETLRGRDSGIQRANAQLDQAERALAVARRPVWSVRAAGHLAVPRMARADSERIDFYKKEVVAAQRMLFNLLMQKRRAAASGELTAGYQAPLARP